MSEARAGTEADGRDARDADVVSAERPAGLAVHAVVRNRRTDKALDAIRLRQPSRHFRLVEAGELAAAVTETEFGTAEMDPAAVRAHAEIVAHLLRRSSVVPAPFGLRARDEAAVRRFLETQRVPLLEALDFFEDCYELRLHISCVVSDSPSEATRGMARHVYEDLRRHARAARILAEGTDSRLLSAAFLISRSEWIRFVEHVGDWESRDEAVKMDITGPWAAYDFVRLVGLGGDSV
ncbi:MAG: GvpL/GvpF family gas vesicle protein [Gemmatimonadota bacterium]